MFPCKMIDFLFKAFPLRIWQDFLIRRHIHKCPLCQAQLASAEEAKPFLIQESEVGRTEHLWPEIKQRLNEKRGKEHIIDRPQFRWAWTAGIAALIVAAVLGFWIYSALVPTRAPAGEDLTDGFQIKYIRVENKPAHAYIYWPQGTEMVIVWAEKNI